MTDDKFTVSTTVEKGRYISDPAKRYLRNARAKGFDVLCAVDIDTRYKNAGRISCVMDHMRLLRYGSRDVGLCFLAAYLSCIKIPRDLDRDELTEMFWQDLLDAMVMTTPNLKENVDRMEARRQELEENYDRDRELTRRDANKPKEVKQ